MLNFVRNKLIDWKVVEPNMIDIMNKFIRNQLNKEQLKRFNKYVMLSDYNNNSIIKKGSQFYFVRDAEIINGEPNGIIPSCAEFKNNLLKYDCVIREIKSILYHEDREKVETIDKNKICIRKLWETLK